MGVILACFPCIGKTYCVENSKKYKCAEFDIFKEYNELGAYVSVGTRALGRVKDKLTKLLEENDFVFVDSSFEVVRYLREWNLENFWVIHPREMVYDVIYDYTERFKKSGKSQDWINLMLANFDDLISAQKKWNNGEKSVTLRDGEYLSELLDRYGEVLLGNISKEEYEKQNCKPIFRGEFDPEPPKDCEEVDSYIDVYGLEVHKGEKIVGLFEMAAIIGGGVLDHIYKDKEGNPWIIYTADRFGRKVGAYDGKCYTSEKNFNKKER